MAMRMSPSQGKGNSYYLLSSTPMLPVIWPRCVWRLPGALRAIVSNDLLSVRALTPVTWFSLRLATRAGKPRRGDPTYTTACYAGPEFSRVVSTRTQTEVW